MGTTRAERSETLCVEGVSCDALHAFHKLASTSLVLFFCLRFLFAQNAATPAEIHYRQGMALMSKHDWKGAVAEFNKALSLQSDRVELYDELGIALVRLNEQQEA